MSNQDDARDSTAGNSREREVTDPVTRRPLLIHDSSSSELEKLSLEQLESTKTSKNGSSMEELIQRETRQPWWTDPDDGGKRFRTRLAVFVGAAAGVGGTASIFLSSILGRMFNGGGSGGSSRLVWTDLLVGSLGCTIIALATAGFAFYHDVLDITSQQRKGEGQQGKDQGQSQVQEVRP